MTSIVQFCAALPVQRHSIEAKGRLLRLPRFGAVVVPYHDRVGYWDCVVVRAGVGPEGEGYLPGGHNIAVFDCEIETAEELFL